MKYNWSAKNNVFIPIELIDVYNAAGWSLVDAIGVNDNIAEEYMGAPPEGKFRSVDKGMPKWVDVEGYEPESIGRDY